MGKVAIVVISSFVTIVNVHVTKERRVNISSLIHIDFTVSHFTLVEDSKDSRKRKMMVTRSERRF